METEPRWRERGRGRLRVLGYWRRTAEDVDPLPHPSEMVDPDWDARTRRRVLAYLQRATFVLPVMALGHSPCRMCRRRWNGCGESSDGVFVWPEGLAHYVADHDVRLPDDFVQHVIVATRRKTTKKARR